MKTIFETMPDGRTAMVDRHDDGRLAKLTITDESSAGAEGIVETYEPQADGSLKITMTGTAAGGTAVITPRRSQTGKLATETARAAAAAIHEATAAQRRQKVRETAEKVVDAALASADPVERRKTVGAAYDQLFGAGASPAAALWRQRLQNDQPA